MDKPLHLAEMYLKRGNELCRAGRYEEAVESFNQAITLQPDYADAYRNRGAALEGLLQYEEALASYDKALALNNRNAGAYYNRGNVFLYLKKYSEALANYNKAIECDPNYAEVYLNRGVTLEKLNRYEEALNDHDKGIGFMPKSPAAYNNAGTTFNKLNQHDKAMICFNKAISLDPDGHGTFNKAMLLLLLGKFEEGWKLYEWRKKDLRNGHRALPGKLWLGEESLAGKTILLHAEQGLGDSIQFCRYVPMVKALGAQIVLQIQPHLLQLMVSFQTIAQVTPISDALPPYDLHCPLGSLPLAFKTGANSIPANVPYLFVPAHTQEKWKNILGKKTRMRVGLTWSGSALHENDHNRSIAFKQLAPLLALNADYHVLQTDIRPADRATLSAHDNVFVHGDGARDFLDTAALTEQMDMVISVDTSIAHLTGALGKKLWLLLPFAPDFRWMLEREDSPWYPTARLFRQPQTGDWDSVIAKAEAELKRF